MRITFFLLLPVLTLLQAQSGPNQPFGHFVGTVQVEWLDDGRKTPQGVIRLAIGGDSRNDSSDVVPWAFKETAKRGAKAFFFLGDLKITRAALCATALGPWWPSLLPLDGEP